MKYLKSFLAALALTLTVFALTVAPEASDINAQETSVQTTAVTFDFDFDGEEETIEIDYDNDGENEIV